MSPDSTYDLHHTIAHIKIISVGLSCRTFGVALLAVRKIERARITLCNFSHIVMTRLNYAQRTALARFRMLPEGVRQTDLLAWRVVVAPALESSPCVPHRLKISPINTFQPRRQPLFLLFELSARPILVYRVLAQRKSQMFLRVGLNMKKIGLLH